MSIKLWGVRFRCDLCGAEADVPDRTPLDGSFSYALQPGPPGWANLTLLSITAKDVYSAPLNNLCEACSALSIGELAARLNAQMTQQAAVADG